MVGTIPILLHTPLDSLFINLSVLFVNSFSEITVEFLEASYKNFIEKEFDFSTLYTDYW